MDHTLFTYRNLEELRKIQEEREVFTFTFVETKEMIDTCPECYSSIEQYMMYQKVIMFRQYGLAQKILASADPSEIKKLGRTHFSEFNADTWDKTCYAIVKRGIRAKFEQNPKLLEMLLNTGEKVLAECSAKDTKWGIGTAIDDPNCYHPSQ